MTDITTRGAYRNNIPELSNLDSYDFESIFKMCFDVNKQAYFYNIIKTVNIPNSIDNDLYTTIDMPAKMPLPVLSHRIYGTVKLWWLICTVNNIHDPVKLIPAGVVLKTIRPRHVPFIIDQIKQNLVD